jgi:hypothetical protein
MIYRVSKRRNTVALNYVKKQRNKVNNMNKIGEENFENNLECILLENSSNPKTYCKIM